MECKAFKLNLQLVLCVPALLLHGCASRQAAATVLESVRPTPLGLATRAPGYLVVYTALIEPKINPDTMFYPHTGYAIYDRHGAFYETVRNHLGAWDENPDTVSLPCGQYTVKAESEFAGDVEVPVIIECGRTTVVDLRHRDHRVAGS